MTNGNRPAERGPKAGKGAGRKKGAVQVPEVRIGEKVRGLRKKNGYSIQKLAELSGVSPAGVYKIETNGMVPTVTTLMKLAVALEQPVSYFVEVGESLPEVRCIRKGERTLLASGQEGRTEVVAERLRGGRLETLFRTLEAGARSRAPHVQAGCETLVYCVRGDLVVRRGEEAYRLKEGDSLHHQAGGKVMFENAGRAAAQFLVVHAHATVN
ncbi:MAG: helix-turn-helix transcriptional regulator [Candidatus Tectomicrobia bacterium]|nr:helix-turn-helix transcriptional regulator [Candidatus Tectomicrobia bacterium]MBI3026360.1 helix-turn-helix transcriptional regulator [Candidatus Tectomicrobia bacterium]